MAQAKPSRVKASKPSRVKACGVTPWGGQARIRIDRGQGTMIEFISDGSTTGCRRCSAPSSKTRMLLSFKFGSLHGCDLVVIVWLDHTYKRLHGVKFSSRSYENICYMQIDMYLRDLTRECCEPLWSRSTMVRKSEIRGYVLAIWAIKTFNQSLPLNVKDLSPACSCIVLSVSGDRCPFSRTRS